jgi:tetratricopeptide (TPR) repeat protein
MKIALTITLGLGALMTSACGSWLATSKSTSASTPAAVSLPADTEASESAIRFLEHRVKSDPDDFIAHNKLAGYYLQRLRETGNLSYLELATRAARASLKAVPAEMNAGGLGMLAEAEYAAHDFAAARDHARQLIELGRSKGYPFQLLGDVLLELGDYDEAAVAFRQMERFGRSAYTEIRLARLAWLRGEVKIAQRRLTDALALALELVPPARETVAWCRWQLGEIAFAAGDYEAAERHARDALVTFPGYYRALAALGRARAARGDFAGAIEQYEQAVRIIPEPAFVAALGDLYHLAGRSSDAAAQYALFEQIARLSAARGALYHRQLALFYADHDLKPEEAYAQAMKEYDVRRDIYGADVVAWTALKAGKLTQAQTAIKEALRLGTQDARLFYHAGMIARAAGDKTTARNYLKRALELSPQFDPLQAAAARKALAE